MPSVLSRCWLGGRKGIRPGKTEWRGAGVVICLQRGADLHMAQLMPLPLTVSCYSKIQIGFTFLVPADLDSPGKRAVKRVCVCVCSRGIHANRHADRLSGGHVRHNNPFSYRGQRKKLEKKNIFAVDNEHYPVPRRKCQDLLSYLLTYYKKDRYN